jgi:hypothetical protein
MPYRSIGAVALGAAAISAIVLMWQQRPRRKRPPAASPPVEPDPQWMEDVAEAYRLGRETKDDEQPTP